MRLAIVLTTVLLIGSGNVFAERNGARTAVRKNKRQNQVQQVTRWKTYDYGREAEAMLGELGRPAAVTYDVSLQGWQRGRECGDLRRKILVMAHVPPDYGETGKAYVTVVRLDNELEEHGTGVLDVRCSQDRVWRRLKGWPEPLTVAFGEAPRTMVVFPALDTHDAATAHVHLPGLVVPQYSGDIPRRIMWCARDTPTHSIPVVEKILAIVRTMNPGYEHVDKPLSEIRAYLAKREGPRAVAAFDAFQPNSYKVDLYRFVALYHAGGVWLDSKMVPLAPLDALLPAKGALLPWDIGRKGVYTGLMAFPPRDELARESVRRIVTNAEQQSYGSSVLDPSGPTMLFTVMQHTYNDGSTKNHSVPWSLGNTGVMLYNDATSRPVVVVHNVEYRRRAVGGAQPCHYSRLWHERAVYHERHCNPVTGELTAPVSE